MLAILRLAKPPKAKFEIALSPPRTRYPAAALPYRSGILARSENTTLPGRTNYWIYMIDVDLAEMALDEKNIIEAM